MTLKRYFVIAGLLLAAVTLWLFPEMRIPLLVMVITLSGLYPLARLFRAIIHRLER